MTSYQGSSNGLHTTISNEAESPLSKEQTTMTKMARKPNGPRPRLCHLHAWPDYDGYGFSLCARKGYSGQFVYQVELGSPADLGGLRNGDRLVEVNGTNVSSENHKQIVERIRSVEGQTVLLVVDAATDKFFNDRRLVISGANLDNVDVIEAPTASQRQSKDQNHSLHTTHEATDTCSSGVKENVSADSNRSSQFRLRLCHVTRWPNFDGYGFMMHTLKDLPGQFIGSVTKNSPADSAGLRSGDRIVEVNGVNVEGDFHKELAAKIQSVIGQISLLVVDSASDKYFHEKGVVMHSGQPFVEKLHSKYIRDGIPDDVIDSCPNRLRLCHLNLNRANSQQPTSVDSDVTRSRSYGFTLRTGADDGRTGQFVGEVQQDSVADRSGLRAGDRLIEVNGMNVETASHLDIIERIRSVGGQTKLLVVDADTDKFLRDRKVSLLYGVPKQLITRCSNTGDSTTNLQQSENDRKAVESNNNNNNTDLQTSDHPYRLRLHRLTLDRPTDVTSSNSKKNAKHSNSRPDKARQEVATYSGSYGFTVHAELRRSGHHIGKVEPGSPSERSGIRIGDRIIEVDGRSVEVESHILLAELIHTARNRRTGNEVGPLELLVVDSEAYKYFTERGLELSSKQPYVERHGFEQTQHDVVQNTFAVVHTEAVPSGGRLRLCQLKRWPNYDGYGFVLLAEQSRNGSYVGRVEEGSPAEAGGLCVGDRIVEVNGVNVEHQSHSEVADRIQTITGLLELLVVDDKSDRYFESQQIASLDRNQPFVETVVCPDSPFKTENNLDGAAHRTSDDEIKKMTEKFRLCQLKIRPDFDGYGFDVITEKHKPLGGHYIGKVDSGSPAEEAGLQKGDLIVEVNGIRVIESSRCSHEQLATRIRTHQNHVTMLVVDQATEKWYRQRGLPLVDTRRTTAATTTTAAEVEKTDNEEQASTLERDSTDNGREVENSIAVQEISQPVASFTETNLDEDNQQHPHRMRLCKLRRWPDYTGYGFNLHVYSGGSCGQSPSVPDQYVIGAVESRSPAEAGGLRRGDRLIAVNGQQIVVIEDDVSKNGGRGPGRSTLDAVAMIKVRPDRVNLLVVDPEAQTYFTDRGLPLDGQQPYIEVIKTPEKGQAQLINAESLSQPAPAVQSRTYDQADAAAAAADPSSDDSDSPNFAGSAREARQRMPKKMNVKNMNISLHEKYELFETM